ncbi:MAG: M28 family peptidase [Thermoanaerobaculia bacterium]|nr:M28 family peptidase [Thermoanaerobaculia bacterium]
MKLRSLALAVLVATPGALAAADFDLPAGTDRAAARITAEALRAPIRFLASDLLEGRGPGSRGDELTRIYLAAQLEALGYAGGAADGSYQQRFAMVGVRAKGPDRWTFQAGERSVGLARHDEYVAASGVQGPTAEIRDAELVFVGYGIEAPEYAWDDYKGVDVAGKVLVMMNNDPDWSDDLFEGTRRLYYGRWSYKYEIAARKGAAGVLIVHTTPSAGYPFQVVQTSWGGEEFSLPDRGEPRIQVKGWATEAASRTLLAAAGHDLDALVASARSRDFRPVPLGLRTSITLANEVRRIETGNVLGRLPGSDPELADEVVVYTAHHDHLGVGAADAEGDTIYNGAIDNGIGCAQLLALARAFVELPERPRRSILFAFVAAEEQGLLGSKYLAENPPVPAGKLAANVNLDAGNAFGRTRDITYIGYGKSSLDRVIEAAAAKQGRVVKGDQFPDRGSFYRSDQFNFAKIGVPALYLDGGTEFVGKDPDFGKRLQERYESGCYHQPCDEVSDEWDFSGLIEDTQIALYCGLAIANADALPTWNPGDEFEAARQAALAAAP